MIESKKKTSLAEARSFFEKELRDVVKKRGILTPDDSFEYLVNLLTGYIESKNFFVSNEQGKLENNLLVDLYEKYLTGDMHTKRQALRRLGDVSLLVSGFFSDSLNKKLVDVDYYFGMGGTAYWTLSSLQGDDPVQHLFKNLSKQFRNYSNLLGEVSERSGIINNSDILRLYEKWLLTGSTRLKEILSEHGITTTNIDTGFRQ